MRKHENKEGRRVMKIKNIDNNGTRKREYK